MADPDGLDILAGAVKTDFIADAVRRHHEILTRVALLPVALMVYLEPRLRFFLGEGDGHREHIAAIDAGHRRRAPMVGRAPEIPRIAPPKELADELGVACLACAAGCHLADSQHG